MVNAPPVAIRKVLCCAAIFSGCFLAVERASAQRGPAPVQVAPIVSEKVAVEQVFLGTVTPARRSVIGSAVAGRVERVSVEEGDSVTANETDRQQLVQLRVQTINIEIAAAKAELKLREQEWNELKNGSLPNEIRRAEARRDAAKALWQYAVQRYERTAKLYEKSGASPEQVAESLSQRVATEQVYSAAEADFELIKEGPRKEKLAQAEARVSVAREEVRRLEDRRGKYTIRAPFSGFVSAKHVEVGDWVQQGDPVMEVVELDPIEIQLGIPERFIPFIRRGMTPHKPIVIDALPGFKTSGRVQKIVPVADSRARTFPVFVRLENPASKENGHLLKAGMLGKVTLKGPPKQALMVPKDALVLNQRRKSVILVVTDPETKQLVARFVPVNSGVTQGSMVEVLEIGSPSPEQNRYVRPGGQVVVKGNERLRPNQPLKLLDG